MEPSPECYPASFVSTKDMESADNVDNADSKENTLEDANAAEVNEYIVTEDDVDMHADGDGLMGEDIIIKHDNSGGIVAKADQVSDYVYRPLQLTGTRSNEASLDETDSDVDVDEDSDSMPLSAADLDMLMRDGQKKRLFYQFLSSHLKYDRKQVKMTNSTLVPILVPIGPSLLRRDRPEYQEKYCHLMLLLFKPWRRASDL
ncbi:hypothetical protein NM688_g1410 [Phlebia brevispora]|uniref:Uncharacterized protein n=1 Tax=Phlebia brevispora TaxID=194682 RepID=A0ACC1TBE0_9APHY|nr:hypothetical protein NM688_g1410 [Phlebia brevispora]